MYFKAALMIGTLRSVIDSDPRFFAMLHDFYQRFKYENILTEDVVSWWSISTGRDLKPFFGEYLRHTALPCLELNFDPREGTVSYKWQADEPAFAMPIRVGDPNHWQLITPNANTWQTMHTPLTKEQFQVATDLYFINVSKT
jgi:aminopeptidase N